MALKKPSQQGQANQKHVTPEQADILANQLADKPYGQEKPNTKKVMEGEIARTTISLPKQLFETIEDMAMTNKRQGVEPKNVSAIVRDALELYLDSKQKS